MLHRKLNKLQKGSKNGYTYKIVIWGYRAFKNNMTGDFALCYRMLLEKQNWSSFIFIFTPDR